MPELRKDPIIGRWVIIATERAKRPDDFARPAEAPGEAECRYCSGKEHQTPPEIFSVRSADENAGESGWNVRVIPSMPPLLQVEGGMDRRGYGMYDVMNGIGAHEIIIDTPFHIANIASLEPSQIAYVFDACVQRMRDLERDTRLRYVLVCKNFGSAAGAEPVRHSLTQLIGLPVIPKRVKEELAGARRYYEYRNRCIFCDMISQELKEKQRVIVHSDGFVAFMPYASRFPFEVWVLPEDHACDFHTLKHSRGLSRVMHAVMRKLAAALHEPPYNYLIHTAPLRRDDTHKFGATIEDDYHWHIEIMPRLTKVAGFELGSGFYINPTPPEEAAGFLREVKV